MLTFDHVGWITRDPAKFEAFWCGILGFKQTYESRLPVEMATDLFQIKSPALIRRYYREGFGPEIEIHFLEETNPSRAPQTFGRLGINHICLHTGGQGSRKQFLDSLPASVKQYIYKNPRGWENIFIRDYEGNWIEIKETF